MQLPAYWWLKSESEKQRLELLQHEGERERIRIIKLRIEYGA